MGSVGAPPKGRAPMRVVMVEITAPARAEAERIGRALVE